jgi:hypothetical protein
MKVGCKEAVDSLSLVAGIGLRVDCLFKWFIVADRDNPTARTLKVKGKKEVKRITNTHSRSLQRLYRSYHCCIASNRTYTAFCITMRCGLDYM